MKSILKLAGVIILAGTLFSSVALAQKTSAGYDKSANFSSYKTFMFPNMPGARNPLVNEMIIAAITRELTARGLTRVAANADLRVSYMAAAGFDLHVGSVPWVYTTNPTYSGVVPHGTASWDVTTGTLVMDLFDNKTDRIVFRGTVKDVLQRAPSPDAAADAKIVSKTVNKGIAKIFKKYPKAAK